MTLQSSHDKDEQIMKAVSDDYLSKDDDILAAATMDEAAIMEKMFE